MYFTIERASGGFRARAYGDNHEQLMISEVYTRKESAVGVVAIIRTYAQNAPVYDRTRT